MVSLSFVVFCKVMVLGFINRIEAAPYDLTSKQIETFQRDGVIVVYGLLQGKQLNNAIKSAKRIQRARGLGQRLLYKLNKSYGNLEWQTWRKYRGLEEVAFESAAPTICAKLMGLDRSRTGDEENRSNPRRALRLLKDAVLGYRAGDLGCGWHVDDKVFWPCEDRNIGKRDAGINVWITLSPVTKEEGGGLAVAPGTHKLGFASKAREAISTSFGGTCKLQDLAPECHEKMEELKTVYDLQPGDAIIHDRYVFHRSHPFVNPSSIKSRMAGSKQRISLRYVPSDSTFFDNNLVDREIVSAKGISTGDHVSRGGEYFPQCWPNRLKEEESMQVLAEKNPFTLKLLLNMARSTKKQ